MNNVYLSSFSIWTLNIGAFKDTSHILPTQHGKKQESCRIMTHVKASFIIDRAQHCNVYIASIPGFECLYLPFVCLYIINFINENRHYWGGNQEGIKLLEKHTSSPLLSSYHCYGCVNHSESSSQNNCSSPSTNISMAYEGLSHVTFPGIAFFWNFSELRWPFKQQHQAL